MKKPDERVEKPLGWVGRTWLFLVTPLLALLALLEGLLSWDLPGIWRSYVEFFEATLKGDRSADVIQEIEGACGECGYNAKLEERRNDEYRAKVTAWEQNYGDDVAALRRERDHAREVVAMLISLESPPPFPGTRGLSGEGKLRAILAHERKLGAHRTRLYGEVRVLLGVWDLEERLEKKRTP